MACAIRPGFPCIHSGAAKLLSQWDYNFAYKQSWPLDRDDQYQAEYTSETSLPTGTGNYYVLLIRADKEGIHSGLLSLEVHVERRHVGQTNRFLRWLDGLAVDPNNGSIFTQPGGPVRAKVVAVSPDLKTVVDNRNHVQRLRVALAVDCRSNVYVLGSSGFIAKYAPNTPVPSTSCKTHTVKVPSLVLTLAPPLIKPVPGGTAVIAPVGCASRRCIGTLTLTQAGGDPP